MQIRVASERALAGAGLILQVLVGRAAAHLSRVHVEAHFALNANGGIVAQGAIHQAGLARAREVVPESAVWANGIA